MNLRTLLMKAPGRSRFCFFALFVLLVAGCDFPGAKNAQRRPVVSDESLAFDVLYAENCSGCHGAAGDLDPLRRSMMGSFLPSFRTTCSRA